MEIVNVIVGGGIAIVSTLIVSFFQSKERKLDRVDKLREVEEKKVAGNKESQLAALRAVALALHRVSRELGLSATTAALDAGETKDQFELRHRNLIDFFDAAHVQVIGWSESVPSYLNRVSAAVSLCWGHIGNAIRLNTMIDGKVNSYQRASDQALNACIELNKIVAESLSVVTQEISDALV